MPVEGPFQGVVCCCLDPKDSVQNSVLNLFGVDEVAEYQGINCYNLKLNNKYYETTIHLLDFDGVPKDEEKQALLLGESHAIILCGDGIKLTVELLDQKIDALKQVQGEPRILLCKEIDEDCSSYRTLLDWSISNGYELILTNDDQVKQQMIDSLSAYRWAHRIDKKIEVGDQKPELDREVMRKLMDFDSLLSKLSAYRDQPELRGNPEDKNIVEIAEILTGLLGDDVDEFLENEESVDISNKEQKGHQEANS